jgi:hypothetical protein
MAAPQIHTSLRFLFAFDKRRTHIWEAKVADFFWRGEMWLFAGGFCKKRVFGVVFLW